jgi:hypothetical protein
LSLGETATEAHRASHGHLDPVRFDSPSASALRPAACGLSVTPPALLFLFSSAPLSRTTVPTGRRGAARGPVLPIQVRVDCVVVVSSPQTLRPVLLSVHPVAPPIAPAALALIMATPLMQPQPLAPQSTSRNSSGTAMTRPAAEPPAAAAPLLHSRINIAVAASRSHVAARGVRSFIWRRHGKQPAGSGSGQSAQCSGDDHSGWTSGSISDSQRQQYSGRVE